MTRDNVTFPRPGRRWFFVAALLFGGLSTSISLAQVEDVPADVSETVPEAPAAESGVTNDLSAIDSNIEIEGEGGTSYDLATGVAVVKGTPEKQVYIKYGDVTIYAGSAEYHSSSGDVYAKDNVSIYRGDSVYKSDSVVYNIHSGQIIADEVRSGLGPLLYDTTDLTLNTQDTEVVELENTLITTHDLENPNYHIKAKKIEIFPDDKVVFRDLKVYLGSTPVLWLPYLSQPFDEELGYSFTPGYSSRWGAFLLNQYGILLNDSAVLTLRLDVRSERGIAGGFELESLRHEDNPNMRGFQAYYAQDQDPQNNFSSQNRTGLDEERYRIGLQHRVYLSGPEDTTFFIDFDINKFSDGFLLQDFFPSEFRVDPRPDNIVNIVKTDPRGELSLWTRFRPNDFYTADSRLPELALDITRQPIFDTGFFYEGETSVGLYRDESSDAAKTSLNARADALRGTLPFSSDPAATQSMIDTLRASASGNEFFRFDTYHQVLFPLALKDGVSLVPRFGVRATAYSDVDGGATAFGDETRFLINAGLEGSFKFSKVYPDVQVPSLGIDEIRHIVQPYFNYSLIVGDELPAGFPLIDRYAPTTRLRPIDLPLFPAVDEIREWNVLRLGTRNRLQTKRDGGSRTVGGDYYNQRLSPRTGDTHNWLELDTFFETYFTDGEFDRDYSNLYNRLTFWPLPWLVATFDSQLPVFNDAFDFTEINSDLTFMPWRHTELTIGHRLLSNHPFFGDSSLLNIRTYTRFSDNWGFSMQHRYELDDNIWEMQQYSLHRDLSSWTIAIGGMILDNRVDEEYGFVLSLSLKDFPRARLPLSVLPGSEGL